MESRTWSILAVAMASGVLWAAEQKLDSGPPLANDLGPKEVDVSGYPAEMQEGYKLLLEKCSKCHAVHRPLNAQYVQPEGDADAQKAAIAKLREANPELFQDKNVWQIEPDVWKRFVKRMMDKPGSGFGAPDKRTAEEKAMGKRIYEFLVFDSQERKLKNPKAWETARKKMLAAFKQKQPEEYKKAYGK